VLFRQLLSLRTHPWLDGHRVNNAAILPAAAYVESMLEVAQFVASGAEKLLSEQSEFSAVAIEDLRIQAPTEVPAGVGSHNGCLNVQVSFDRETREFCYWSKPENESNADWQVKARAQLGEASSAAGEVHNRGLLKQLAASLARDASAATESNRSIRVFTHQDVYERFEMLQLRYDGAFKLIQELRSGDDASYGVLDTSNLAAAERYVIHPGILDCAFQVIIGCLRSLARTYLPQRIARVEVARNLLRGALASGQKLHVFSKLNSLNDKEAVGDIFITCESSQQDDVDGAGKQLKVLATVEGLVLGIVQRQDTDTAEVNAELWQSISLAAIEPPRQLIVPDGPSKLDEWSAIDRVQRSLFSGMIKWYIQQVQMSDPSLLKIDHATQPLHVQRRL
jgi:acyl transferase domain-containing protein